MFYYVDWNAMCTINKLKYTISVNSNENRARTVIIRSLRSHDMVAIIFDLDGTLLNSLDDLGNAMNATLLEFGYPIHPMESYKTFVGNGLRKLCERALMSPKDNFDEIFARFLQNYEKQESVAQVYPSVLETLKELNGQGIPIAVHTNKMQGFTDTIMKHFFHEIEFTQVIGDRVDGKNKPNPHHTLNIIADFPGNIEHVYFVGDSDVDMFTAHNAGAIPVGVSWGFRSVEQLQGAGSAHIIDDMKEILNVIK